jgi:ABC-type glycerol-3-phosphate transport system permease component
MKGLRKLQSVAPIHLVLLSVSFVNLFPVYYMIVTSFKAELEAIRNPLGLPTEFELTNYFILLFEKGFPRLFLNSAILTLSSVLIALAISCLAAYALAIIEFPGRQLILDFITALMAIPPIVVVIPLFVLMNSLRLVNTYPSAIIVYIGFILPFSVFILTGFFLSVPKEILEAAKIDGAGDLRILISVIVPMSKAPLMTLIIVNGMWVWNELLIAILFLQKEEMRTLMAGIAYLHGRNIRNIPLIMSGSVLASLPMLLALAIGQQAFVKGLMAGQK